MDFYELMFDTKNGFERAIERDEDVYEVTEQIEERDEYRAEFASMVEEWN